MSFKSKLKDLSNLLLREIVVYAWIYHTGAVTKLSWYFEELNGLNKYCIEFRNKFEASEQILKTGNSFHKLHRLWKTVEEQMCRISVSYN
jgi:hypothetical protein